MKRIELVLSERAFYAFQQLAAELEISEFDVAEVCHSSSRQIERARLYRGQPFTLDLVPRTKVEFIVPDQKLQQTVDSIDAAIEPDSIAVFNLQWMSNISGDHRSGRMRLVPHSQEQRTTFEAEGAI